MSKKISYYSVVNKQKSPGVFKKIQGTVAAFNALGLEATNKCYSNNFSDTAGNDSDFIHDEGFRLMVPNNDSVEEIVELLVWLTENDLPKLTLVRKFTEENLNLQVKVERSLNGLISY